MTVFELDCEVTGERKGAQWCGLETELLSGSAAPLLSDPVSLLSCLVSPSIPTTLFDLLTANHRSPRICQCCVFFV